MTTTSQPCSRVSVREIISTPNWTGLTLAQLVDAGRIDPTDAPTITQWVKATLGDPRTLDELHNQRALAQEVISTLTPQPHA